MKYQGISISTSEAIENASVSQLKQIDKALVAAAYKMRDNARRLFTSNDKGYQIASIADGIMLGRLRKDAAETTITLHAMGNSSNPKSWKARIFAGGAYHRRTRNRGRNRGSIEDLKTIEKSTDQRILDSYINNAIK